MISCSRNLRYVLLLLLLLQFELICRGDSRTRDRRGVTKEARFRVVRSSEGSMGGIHLVVVVAIWLYPWRLHDIPSRRSSRDDVIAVTSNCDFHLLCEIRRLFLKVVACIADYDLKSTLKLRHRLLKNRHTRRRCTRLVLLLLLLLLRLALLARSIKIIGEIIGAAA